MSQPQGQPPAYGGQPQGYNTQQGVTVVSTQPQVVATGSCPVCHIGYMVEDYTGLGICLAIFFFPLGVLCCLALRERRCSHCGASF